MDIFIVDDERIIGETLAIILRGGGYSVRAFQSWEEALEAQESRPRLLLTDFRMAGMSGTELAYAMNRSIPCEVIVFSSDLQESDPEWQRLLHAIPSGILLQKPLDPRVLLREVHALLSPVPTLLRLQPRPVMADRVTRLAA